MKNLPLRSLVASFVLLVTTAVVRSQAPIEIVAELDLTPGNVVVSKDGRIFMTVHPLRKSTAQLVEIIGRHTVTPFPNAAWNRKPGSGYDVINTPLGLVVDNNNVLWVIDVGSMVQKPFQPKLLAFQVETGELVYRYDFPADVAPRGSFVQDLVVDTDNKFVYLADVGVGGFKPAIVVLDYESNRSRRFEASPTLAAEDIEMMIDGEAQVFRGKPLRVGINPIHLSADNETLIFGSMSGANFHRLPTRLLREFASDAAIAASIERAGPKAPSDGGTIDQAGNLYFTNVGNHSVDRLTPAGKVEVLAKDEKLMLFPDNIRIGPDGWLYVAVNQLNKTAAWTKDGKDQGRPPYHVVRVKTDAKAVWGR